MATLALVALIGLVWSRLEDELEQRASRAWPQQQPDLRFSDQQPNTVWWGLGMASPRVTLARIEGGLLHRRLVLAAREFISRDGEYDPFDGLDVVDGGEPFQAVVRSLRGKPHRWLIIVRDPAKVSEEFSATTSGPPVVSEPAVLAAVVRYKQATRNWQITVEELHALDAAYVAGCALVAWQQVARERDLATAGTTATAKLDQDEDGITWDITLHVLTSERDAEDAVDRLDDLLGDLRVPLDVWAESALPADDGQDSTASQADRDRDDELAEPEPADSRDHTGAEGDADRDGAADGEPGDHRDK
jgi:hypothetical protein